MRRLIYAISTVLLLCGLLFTHADEVDGYVKAQMQKHQIPGLALMIVRDGQPARTNTYGVANVELNSPVRPETVFEIGSITKQFTAGCILLLQEEGKLSVDDAISKHLPSAPIAWSNITIRHLLTHTSGIRSYTGQDGFEVRRRLTQDQFIKAVAALTPDFAAGEQAKYCNSGYNLLGYIIENVSGRTYWAFLAERIWTPLGIATATNRDPAIVVPNRAAGYERKNGALRNRDGDLTDVFAAGAIVATVGDLARWNAAIDSNQLLRPATKEQMWTPVKLNDGKLTAYGFGWRIGQVNGRRNVGHSGSTAGFSASLQKYPEDKLTVIILCNSDEPNIATTMARAIAALSVEKEQE